MTSRARLGQHGHRTGRGRRAWLGHVPHWLRGLLGPCPLLPLASSLPSIKCLRGLLSVGLMMGAGEPNPVLGEALFPWGSGTARWGWEKGLQAELRSRPWPCPRHTVPAGVSRWPGRPARSASHWSAATGGVSCLALGCCGSRGQWGPFRLPCPSPPPLASLMRVVWQGCVRGHLTASGPGKRSCKGPEAGVSLLREPLGPSQEGMGGRPEAGPLCGFGLKQIVTMPVAQITSAEPRSQAAELPRSRRERGAGSCQV